MFNKIRLLGLLVIILAFALNGCYTRYHSRGFTGGYSDDRIQENIFQVRFVGNAHTSQERAMDMALLRCAEVTMMHGFSYFKIISRDVYYKSSLSNKNSMGNQDIVNRPRVNCMISCFNEIPDQQRYAGGEFFDARAIRRSLGAKYNL